VRLCPVGYLTLDANEANTEASRVAARPPSIERGRSSRGNWGASRTWAAVLR